MRLLFWILGGLTALLCVVLWTRIQILITVRDGQISSVAKVGLLPFFRYPSPPGGAQKKKKRKKKPSPKEEGAEEKPARPGVPVVRTVREGLRRLPEPLRRVVLRLFHGIRVEPLRVWIAFGGMGSPDTAAETYGRANALLWGGMPLLERILDIRSPEIGVAVDFTADETTVEGECGVSLRIGTLLVCGLIVGVPVVRYLLWMGQASRNQAKTPEGKAHREPDRNTDTNPDGKPDGKNENKSGGKG